MLICEHKSLGSCRAEGFLLLCHSERSEESHTAQVKLSEESIDSSLKLSSWGFPTQADLEQMKSEVADSNVLR
jgi:hypothetical protein